MTPNVKIPCSDADWSTFDIFLLIRFSWLSINSIEVLMTQNTCETNYFVNHEFSLRKSIANGPLDQVQSSKRDHKHILYIMLKYIPDIAFRF